MTEYEKFEAWQKEGIKFNTAMNEYENIFIQHRWEGWQACAESKQEEIKQAYIDGINNAYKAHMAIYKNG